MNEVALAYLHFVALIGAAGMLVAVHLLVLLGTAMARGIIRFGQIFG